MPLRAQRQKAGGQFGSKRVKQLNNNLVTARGNACLRTQGRPSVFLTAQKRPEKGPKVAKTKEQLEEQLAKLYEQQEKAIAENADRDWLIAISNAIIETTYQLQKAGN